MVGDRPVPSPEPLTIRDATEADIGAIWAINANEIRNGVATFDETPGSDEDLRARVAEIQGLGLPYLVAERINQVVGYAYAAPYRTRRAYRLTVEDSVYVADWMQGQGVGRALLSAVIARCEQGTWRQMVAVIGGSDNKGSIALHEKLGFRHVGTLEKVGYKFGRWVDTVLMQRSLGPDDTP
ncbi:MAG: N-acetyltransferase family protein [Inquilinaceae bacterium]